MVIRGGMGMYSAEMEMMQAWFSRMKERRKNRILGLVWTLQRRGLGRWNRGCRRWVRERVRWRPSEAAALRIAGCVDGRRVVLWSGQVVRVRGDSVARESTRHMTAFCSSQLGNTRAIVRLRKEKVTATKLNCRLTRRRVAAVPMNSVVNLSKNYATGKREYNLPPVHEP